MIPDECGYESKFFTYALRRTEEWTICPETFPSKFKAMESAASCLETGLVGSSAYILEYVGIVKISAISSDEPCGGIQQ